METIFSSFLELLRFVSFVKWETEWSNNFKIYNDRNLETHLSPNLFLKEKNIYSSNMTCMTLDS